jgi:uncharacterized protein (TIGR02118 family)
MKMNLKTLLLPGAAAVATIAPFSTAHAQSANETKITVLYGQPKSPEDFDKYYLGTHMALVNAVRGVKRIELAKCLPKADGSAPDFYRITEIYFDSPEQMAAVTGSPEWQKIRDDVSNFAPGGATVLISKIN